MSTGVDLMQPVTFSIFEEMEWGSGKYLQDHYDSVMQTARLADSLHGYSGIYFGEHHFTKLSANASQGVFISYASAVTSRIRIGALVYVTPIRNPVLLSEEICVLDHLTHGRLDIGFGSGISDLELKRYNINGEFAKKASKECNEIMLRYFASNGQPFSWSGEVYKFDLVDPVILPLQRPHPPIWIPTRNLNTIDWVASMGYNTAWGLDSDDVLKRAFERYRNTYSAHHRGENRKNFPTLALQRVVLVADSDRKARELAGPALKSWVDNLLEISKREGGANTYKSRINTGFNVPDFDSLRDIDAAFKKGLIFVGSPETVAEMISKSIQYTGANGIMCKFSFGDLEREDIFNSMELFSREVIPRISA